MISCTGAPFKDSFCSCSQKELCQLIYLRSRHLDKLTGLDRKTNGVLIKMLWPLTLSSIFLSKTYLCVIYLCFDSVGSNVADQIPQSPPPPPTHTQTHTLLFHASCWLIPVDFLTVSIGKENLFSVVITVLMYPNFELWPPWTLTLLQATSTFTSLLISNCLSSLYLTPSVICLFPVCL